MLASYLRAALRNLRRNRGFAALNVVGLALGMACVLLIALYVRDELRFDAFHERADRIARIDVEITDDGSTERTGMTQGILADELTARMPDVEAVVRVMGADPALTVDERTVQADGALLAGPRLFDVFTLPLVAGDPATALDGPGRIVVSQSLARSLFGEGDAVGQTVIQQGRVLTVTGIMADVARTSHLRFDAAISLATVSDPGWWYDNWFAFSFATYALLNEGVTPAALEAQFPTFIDQAAGEALAEDGDAMTLYAVPLSDLYLSGGPGMGDYGSHSTLRILSLIALLVLVVAGVNFTNLATARSLDRAREVGVRRSLGAARAGMAIQFLAEAVVLSLFATLAGIALAAAATPVFQAISEKPVTLLDLGSWWYGVAGLTVVVGLLAGAYPAFVLSGFRPAEVLKGRFSVGQRGSMVRQTLVAGQFAVSIALVAATGIVFAQLDFVQSRDLGFDAGGAQSQLVVVPFSGDSTVTTHMDRIRSRMLAIDGVSGMTASLNVPTRGQASGGGFIEAPDGSEHEMSTAMYLSDTAFARVYGLTLLAGNLPDKPESYEVTLDYLVNEAAAKEAGYTDVGEVVGKRTEFWGAEGVIVGVVRDFHTAGLQQRVAPVAVIPTPGDGGGFLSTLTFRVDRADLPATLGAMQTVWADLVPSRTFDYSFLDESFAAQYASERRFGRLFGLFAGLAIVIALLGLFGLAAHSASKRVKEIGVRRVLGATVVQVVALLGRGTVALVVVSVLLAVPAVVFGMNRWLDSFAYRIDVGWLPFVGAGLLVLGLALATVAYHAVRAARANPAASLRSEYGAWQSQTPQVCQTHT